MSTFNAILKKHNLQAPLLYGISNRQAFPQLDADRYLELIFATSAHLLQWREKDLDARATRPLVRCGVRMGRRSGRLFLVNSLVELALDEGADGAHLTSHQDLKEADRLRRDRGPDFLLGQSVHSLQQAVRAQREGADYVFLSPIFTPLSKTTHSPPLGLSRLKVITQSLQIPVFALGGLSRRRFAGVIQAGAIGAAGITWLQREIQSLLQKGH